MSGVTPNNTGQNPHTTSEVILDMLYGLMSSSSANDENIAAVAAEDTVTGITYAFVIERDETTGTTTFTYYDGDGNVFVPVNPMRVVPTSGVPAYAEDSPHTSGDLGLQMLAVRNEGFATLSNTNLDYTPIAVDRFGNVYTHDTDAITLLTTISGNLEPLTLATPLGNDSVVAPTNRVMLHGGIRNDLLATTMASVDGYASHQSMTSLGEAAVVSLGRDADNAAITISRHLLTGGKAVDADSYSPAYTASDAVMFAFDIDTGRMLVDSKERPSASSEYTPTSYSSVAYENAEVLKASAGVLYGITGYNSGPAQWIQIHNTTSVPADTAVPMIIFYAQAASNFFWTASEPYGWYCSTGITVVNSTTGPTKTIGAANCWFNAQFK